MILHKFFQMNKSPFIHFIQIQKYSQTISKEFNVQYLTGENTGIALLSFNRPKKRNALGATLLKDMDDALNQIITVEPQPRVALLRSTSPGIFCAGADLIERAALTNEQTTLLGKTLRNLTSRVFDLPFPVIACIDGAALGGGLEFALACDIRVASSDAKMGLVETSWAIFPGAGGTQYLPKLINPSVAKELIYTAQVMTGKEAKDFGIVNHVVEQNVNKDAAYVKALEIAQKILPNGPIGVKLGKMAINKGLEVDLYTGLAIEGAYYGQLLPTEDRKEGLRAFKEKRKPSYKGR